MKRRALRIPPAAAWFLGAALAAGLGAEPAAAPRPAFDFDVLIRNGRIVDGTGNPWFHGDVGIRGGRIAAVGPLPSGRAALEIDAQGLAVAPGFIDIHSHSDWVLLEDGRAESKVRQGVTTEVLGEGSSPGPYTGQMAPHPVSAGNQAVRIASLRQYFDTVDALGASVNVASYVGLGNLWQCVMGTSFERPTPEQLRSMERLLAEAMEEGALGLSSMLMMPPGSLASTDDLVALCRVVRRYGGLFSSHIRDEGTGVFDSIRQVIEVARRAEVRLDVIHLKIADQAYWGRMDEVVAMIESARAEGVDVQANVYPYTRGNNNLSSIIPPWAHEGGTAALLERLRNPAARQQLKHDIRQGLPGWYNHFTAVGGDWSRMLVSANNAYRGQTMDAVLRRRSADQVPPPDPLDVMFELLLEEQGSVGIVYAHHTEADMNLALRQPWCSIGSDGSALATTGLLRRGHPHPRNFGTFPRVLGRYVRETHLLGLEEAVRKMTSLNAAKAGLWDRGLLRPGLAADITVFDPATVIDHATYTEPFHYNSGVAYVLVNGQLVLDRDRHTGARPGRALRRSATSPIAPGVQPVSLGELGAGEGPLWHPDGHLLFTGHDRITRWNPAEGARPFRESAGGANGLLLDREGRLIVCEAGRRRVTRTESDGSITVLAERFEGMRFNTPNDLTMDPRGRIYFSDPRYGRREDMEMKDHEGRLVEGVYRIDPDGTLARVIAHEADRPNGLHATSDGRYLYVADNNNNNVGGARKLWRFGLREDGAVEPDSRSLVFDWGTGRGPDGMVMDRAGRLYVAAGLTRPNPPYEEAGMFPGGVYVFGTDGSWLDTVRIPVDEVTNCELGGTDESTLFITAGGVLWQIALSQR